MSDRLLGGAEPWAGAGRASNRDAGERGAGAGNVKLKEAAAKLQQAEQEAADIAAYLHLDRVPDSFQGRAILSGIVTNAALLLDSAACGRLLRQ